MFVTQYTDLILRIAGVVVILMGIVFIGQVSFLQRTIKPGWQPRTGLIGAPLLGIVFAIGWTPCVGPTLIAVQSMVLDQGDLGRALIIGLAYCIGLGIPFLLVAIGFGWVGGSVAWVKRHIRVDQHRGRRAADRHRRAHGVGHLAGIHHGVRGGDPWLREPALTCVVERRRADDGTSVRQRPAAPLRPRRRHAVDRGRRLDHAAAARPDRLPALLLAPADQHAHGARPAAAARPRRGARARWCRSAAPTRTASSQYQQQQSRHLQGARLARTVQHLHLAVVLGHLPAAVRLAGRLHHPAAEAPPRRPARQAAEDAGASASGWSASRAATTTTDAETAIAEARSLLRRQGYRVARYGATRVSAERGYLRETGNLIFHIALVGMLLTVGVFGSFGYTGQRILVQGEPFTNVLADYDSFNPGRFSDENSLQPFQLRLDNFEPKYASIQDGTWMPQDFTANLSTREPGGELDRADPQGELAARHRRHRGLPARQRFRAGRHGARSRAARRCSRARSPFLSQDGNLTSTGVIKVPDGLERSRSAFQGFFCPTRSRPRPGAPRSRRT